MRKFIRASAFVSEILMKFKLSICCAAALVCSALLMLPSEVRSQVVKIKFPLVRYDTLFNNGVFQRLRIDTLWFGIHNNANFCLFDTLTGFNTRWLPAELDTIIEFDAPPDCICGDFKLRRPRAVSDACYPSTGAFIDIRSFRDTTQRDTIGITNTDELTVVGDYINRHPFLKWPSVLSSYFDSAIIINRLNVVTPLIFVNMLKDSTYLHPNDGGFASQVENMVLLLIGPKNPPPPPPVVPLTFPPNGAVDQPLSLTLTWATIPQAAFYRIQVARDSNFSSLIANDSLGPAVTSKALTGLKDATTYFWRVTGYTKFGFSPFQTPLFRFRTIVITVPPVLVAPPNNAQNVILNPSLRWKTITAATLYHVQLSTDTNFAPSAIIVNDSTLTDTFKVVSVQNCVKYFWRARAKYPAAWSLFSAPFKFRAALATPATPTLLSPPNGTLDMILSPTLTWQGDVCTDLTRVQVTTDTTSSLYAFNSKVAGTSVQVGPLLPDQDYFWRARAINTTDSSAPSGFFRFRTKLFPPDPPTLLLPANNDSTQPLPPSLIWAKTPNAATYTLQVSRDAGFAQRVFDDSTLTDTSRLINGLFNCTSYFWRVRAKNAVGSSAFATTRSFKTQKALPGVPLPTLPPNGQINVVESPLLTWTPSSSDDVCAQFYIVVLTKDTGGVPIRRDSISQTSLLVGPLSSQTKYFWNVTAGNLTHGKSTASPWSNFTTTIQTRPDPPLLRFPSNGQDGLPLSPTLRWDSVARASSYRLQVALDSLFTLLLVNDSTIIRSNTPARTVGPLPFNNRAYYWRVNAKNSAGTSVYSDTWSFRTLAPPAAPTLLLPVVGEVGVPVSPSFFWTIAERADSYRLQISRDSVFINGVVKDDSNITSTNWPLGVQLSGFTKYYWRVFGKNSVGYGDPSPLSWFVTERTGRPNWTMPISVCEAGPACDTVYFSITVGATYGIDVFMDEVELPPPAVGWFDLRFTDNRTLSVIGEGLRVNRHPFRAFTQIDTFKLRFQPGLGSYPMVVSWNRDSVAQVCDSMIAMDEYTGAIVHKNMKLFSSVATNLSSLLIVEYGAYPTVLGVKPPAVDLPQGFTLSQNYPNPFNPTTRLSFSTQKSAAIRIAVYDVLGREISVLADRTFAPGLYYTEWDATQMPSGVYYVRMLATALSGNGPAFTAARKIIMMK